MFFPDWSFFAKLCGASSINSIVLTDENRNPRADEYNEVIHKDLRKFLAGKDMSRKGLNRLVQTYFDYAPRRGIEVTESMASLVWDQIEIIVSEEVKMIDISELRSQHRLAFADFLPPKTCDQLSDLLVSSLSMKERIARDGPSALLSKLEQKVDPKWQPFFDEMAKRTRGANAVPQDVIACLQIMGGLSVLLIFWFEALCAEEASLEEKIEGAERSLQLLFAVDQGRAQPARAVAALIEHALHHSDYATQKGFIEAAFGETEHQLREGLRYFAGTKIPTFEQSRDAIRASKLKNAENPKEDDVFVLIAQFIARSYVHLDKKLDQPLPDALKPHFIFFDHFRNVLQARANGEPAIPTSADHSMKDEEQLS